MKIKHILLFLIAWVSSMSLAYAQQTVVASGSVMDEKGELLIGVSISVKEVPSMGAITDIDGRFKIGGIKAGHTLVISYVGYDPQEIKMNKSNERMRVVLKESSNVMDEVVITASGKVQKKINVTGAITGVEVATLKTPTCWADAFRASFPLHVVESRARISPSSGYVVSVPLVPDRELWC